MVTKYKNADDFEENEGLIAWSLDLKRTTIKSPSYNLCSKNKGTDQPHVSVQLICSYVFEYVISMLSHDVAHLISAI